MVEGEKKGRNNGSFQMLKVWEATCQPSEQYE